MNAKDKEMGLFKCNKITQCKNLSDRLIVIIW